MSNDPVRIVVLFPDLLGTYGDGGNGLVLHRRLQWRGIASELIDIHSGEPVPEDGHLYLLGGGEDAPQIEAARALGTDGPVHRAIGRGAVVLAVCAGMQIAGTSFPDSEGGARDGLGLLDCVTVKTTEPRAVGELLVDVDPAFHLPPLTGFENHGGRTRLGPTARTLGRVRAGVGNGDGSEGVVSGPSGSEAAGGGGPGTVVGTYLHGPVLARNPALADLLLAWALDQPVTDLAPLLEPDAEAEALRAERLLAVERGNLDGVARRTWRDRLTGRS